MSLVSKENRRKEDRPITDKELQKLSYYEKLEDKVSWIFDGKLNIEMAIEQIIKSIEEKTGEKLAYSRILTNNEAKKWDRWLTLEEEERLLPIPCKLGSIVYKICPVCNENHRGNCDHCAWCGCQPDGCDVGVGVYSSGSCNREKALQVIPRRLWPGHLFTILENWNTMYFATEEEAQKAIEEYDEIRFTEDRTERYEKYLQWCKDRETIYRYSFDKDAV